MPRKLGKSRERTRPPRIRVPNNERALFIVDTQKFVGVIQRLSLTGGSAVLVKGPMPHGTMGKMGLNTVFGKVTAEIEFLQSGADGIPQAQAFRFLAMDDVSAKRFSAAAKQMEAAGFSDVEAEDASISEQALQTFNKLQDSIRRLAGIITPGRRAGAKG